MFALAGAVAHPSLLAGYTPHVRQLEYGLLVPLFGLYRHVDSMHSFPARMSDRPEPSSEQICALCPLVQRAQAELQNKRKEQSGGNVDNVNDTINRQTHPPI